MNHPRMMLAAPASGSGKTTVTCGILRALVQRGVKVSSFKCGPDYIDPLFHETVLGTKSGNLDLFFQEPSVLRYLFCERARDTELSVLEGVMGYYDGMAAHTWEGSSYDVARMLGAPVILVVNARGQSLSALATLRGFLGDGPDSGIRGVIFNQMSQRVYEALSPQVEKLGVKPLGYVPRTPELMLESRHLGLVTPGELEHIAQKMDQLAALLEETVDIDGMLTLARAALPLDAPPPPLPAPGKPVILAVARDEAFCFLYGDNLALLERLGAELRFFSPLSDDCLPSGCQGILLCGGYPELYGQRLSQNVSMRQCVRSAIAGGMPCLAECGGFLYLHQQLEDWNGTDWPMVGAVAGRAYNTGKLNRFGYLRLTANHPGSLLVPGEELRGHEFHYYESESCGTDCTAAKPFGGKTWACIHGDETLFAGFPHLSYWSNPRFVSRFLQQCAQREGL